MLNYRSKNIGVGSNTDVQNSLLLLKFENGYIHIRNLVCLIVCKRSANRACK